MKKVEEIVNCPECDSTHISRDYSRAELVCNDCGFVIDEDLIDHGPEWRAFDSEQREKRARVGAPMTYIIHDKGLSTMIGWKNSDSYGKSIPTRNRAQLCRLRTWQRRLRISDAMERNLAAALIMINTASSRMGLPRSVRETTAMIYRKAILKNLIRSRSIECVVSAALYAACRQCNLPRTLDEIASSSRASRKEIGRAYRFISRELGLKLMPTSPQDYISRFCSELKLSSDVQAKALDLLREIRKTDKDFSSGRAPNGTAAAALYIATMLCDERRNQVAVGKVSGVTEVTIRTRYVEIVHLLGIDQSKT